MDNVKKMIAAVEEATRLLHISYDLDLLERNLVGEMIPEKVRALAILQRLRQVAWYEPLDKVSQELARESK